MKKTLCLGLIPILFLLLIAALSLIKYSTKNKTGDETVYSETTCSLEPIKKPFYEERLQNGVFYGFGKKNVDTIETDIIEETLSNTTADAPLLDDDTSASVYGVSYTIHDKTYDLTETELKSIAAVIQLEVMGENSTLHHFEDTTLKYWEMLSVAQCIRNRLEDNQFPNNVLGVITDSHSNGKQIIYQFTSSLFIDKIIPTQEAITAAKEVFSIGVTVLPCNYFYFCASSVELNFEKINSYCLIKTSDDVFEKIRGHLTTFYAGR